jgi:hypothetical protein
MNICIVYFGLFKQTSMNLNLDVKKKRTRYALKITKTEELMTQYGLLHR